MPTGAASARRPDASARQRTPSARSEPGASFPYRAVTPQAYVASHRSAMTAYTYDDYAYPDPELQGWLDEVGRLLRAGPTVHRR